MMFNENNDKVSFLFTAKGNDQYFVWLIKANKFEEGWKVYSSNIISQKHKQGEELKEDEVLFIRPSTI